MWRCTPYQLTKRSFLCLRHFLFSFFLSQCLCVWGVFFLPLVQHIHLFLFIIRFIYIVSFHFSFSSFRSKSVDENWVITCWMQWSTTKFLLFQTKLAYTKGNWCGNSMNFKWKKRYLLFFFRLQCAHTRTLKFSMLNKLIHMHNLFFCIRNKYIIISFRCL